MQNFESSFFEAEAPAGINGHQEFELSPEFEFQQEYGATSAETYELSPEFEWEQPSFETGNGSQAEMELTQELMEVQNEMEFLNWLGNAARKAAGVGLKLLDSPEGRQATRALTKIAQRTLRKGGAAIQRAGNQAADRIPSFVKFATDALRGVASETRNGNPDPVRTAIVRSASHHYPIILKVKGTLQARQMGGNGISREFEQESNEEMEAEVMNTEGTFNEVMEMELASELLAIQNEAELDQFLGKLIKRAAGAVSSFARSSTGRALGGMLKGLARKALPVVGGALGSFVAPGLGTAIGSKLGAAAGNLFELELEGLSAEDREFELSRAFVRFAGNAARRASRLGNMQPSAAARAAIMRAARRYAPGLLVQNNQPQGFFGSNGFADDYNEPAQTGSWYRQGNQVIIQGLFQ